MSSNAIEFNYVTKRYSRNGGLFTVRNFLNRVKNGQFGKKLLAPSDFYALRDVSFSVKPGERLGIIGPNGSGKSTTLKIVQGISYPTTGDVKVHGKVGGLIELGSGFHPELSGRENVYLSTAIQGLSKQETTKVFNEIVAVADVDQFIDMPLKRYSSGMKVRLGFAVAMATVPDIVLMDEVLAVGDMKFREKCMQMLKDYLRGRSLLFVSHSMNQILEICERVIVLNKGRVAFDGDPKEAVDKYTQLQSMSDSAQEHQMLRHKVSRGFSEIHHAKVTVVRILSGSEEVKGHDGTPEIQRGEDATVTCELFIREVLSDLNVEVVVRRSMLGQITEIIGGDTITVSHERLPSRLLTFRFDTAHLKAGEYLIDFAPQFQKQSTKAVVPVLRKRFRVLDRQADTQKSTAFGLLDLNFRILSQEMSSGDPTVPIGEMGSQ